ncbi:serine/threonine-protein kinase [Natronolimnobius baerhuensis]|uniref:serine/threonine-protein kinase n=1 Tax=Natronolimnobius baerhuensis TaxID=253108 RepID=UPI001FE49449|nr:serine/threonine-protein kinase [Natronolimnobius baerhuensis]
MKALADGKYTASKESPSAALPSIREALKNLNAAVDWAKQPNLRTHVKEVEDQWDTARELEFDLLSTLVENSLQRATDEADHGNYRNAVEHVRSANASLDQAVEHANEHDYETEPYQRFRKQLVENGSDWEQKMLVTRINSALNAEPAGYDDALEQLGSVLGQFSEVRLVDDHQLDFLKQEAREAYLSVSIQGTTYLLEEGERHLESEAYARATDAFDEAAEVAATAATRAKPWDDIETDELTAVASMVETRKAEVEVTRINERIGDGIAAFEDGSYESAYETFTAVGEETVEIQGEIADPDDADQLAHLQSVASDNARKAQRASLGIGTENPTMREPNQVATVALEQPDARHQSSGARIQATETIVSAVGSTIATEIPGAPDLEFAYDRLDRDESIGRGGNADVYCATVTVDGTTHTVALKEPRIQGTIGTQVVEEFTQEAETWAKLDDHDHIVGVIDWGSQPLPWIAMEHMDGGHVGDRAGEMPFDHALWTAIVTAEAVRHAHRRGVAHLDLKPENILFRSVTDGWDVPKVADWGLSKHLLEHSKSIEGLSPHYAAPEQFDDNYGSADDITDVCQLGSVYYELFTGRPPFEGQPARVMNKVLTEAPQPPSELADVPPELDEILLTAMAKEKVDRYESVLYLRDALQELYDDQYQQE